MKKGFSPALLGLIAWGMCGGRLDPFSKPQEDEIERHLKLWNRTLEEEYHLVQQKKSSLSARLRDVVVYRYEQKLKEGNDGR
jgi:hypothetical protein